MRKEGPREVEQDPLMIMRGERERERMRDEGEIDPLLLFLSFY